MSKQQSEIDFSNNFYNYLRAVQERVTAFFLAIKDEDIEQKISDVSDLWYQIVLSEVESFNKLLYSDDFKNNDNNFIKRKGYRNKNIFAFDLITNWAFERSILPYIHKYSGLNDCSEFYLNPETCDNDARLGWGINQKSRKINANHDFLTKINNEIHNVELKSMFIYNRRSANIKVFCTPKDKNALDNHHIIFLHFNGIGNPKEKTPKQTRFKIFYIPWKKLIKTHVHYPPQLDRKPCYLIHFKGEEICEQHSFNGIKNKYDIGENKDCLIFDNIVLQKVLRYDEITPYLNKEKYSADNILKVIKQY